MQRFRKYEIATTTWATLKKKIEKTTEEGSYYNTDLVAVVVELGKLCKEWGDDAEGNPTASNKRQKKVSTSFGTQSRWQISRHTRFGVSPLVLVRWVTP
jgi:hypothetical protein